MSARMLPDPYIIGMMGAAGAGKDTAAERLVDLHSFEPWAFAQPIKDMIEALLISCGLDHACLHERALKEQPLPGLRVSPRQLMQTLGTEWGRNIISPDLWVRATEMALGLWDLPRNAPVHDRIVITDVRMPNEAAWVRSFGGVIVRIDRPGLAPIPLAHHASEASAGTIRADYIIINDGTVGELHERVDALMRRLIGVEAA